MTQYAGGSGTSADPYLIATWEHLRNISLNQGSYFALINDIDCSGAGNWIVVSFGPSHLDGRGHRIYDVFSHAPTPYEWQAGLFTSVVGGSIRRLWLDAQFSDDNVNNGQSAMLTRDIQDGAVISDICITGAYRYNYGAALARNRQGATTVERCVVMATGWVNNALYRDLFVLVLGGTCTVAHNYVLNRAGFTNNDVGATIIPIADLANQSFYNGLDFANTWVMTPIGPRLRPQGLPVTVTVTGAGAIRTDGTGADAVALIDRATNQVAASTTPDPITGAWTLNVPPGEYYRAAWSGDCAPYIDGPHIVTAPE